MPSTRRDYDIDVNGVRLRCSEFGPSAGDAVVLLHATGQDRGSWDAVAEHLATRSWRVVAVDQRGHGDSGWTEDYSFEIVRDDVAGVIEALDLAPAVVVGHSMGGTVAILLAEQHPELVSCLVLEDTPPPRRVPESVPFPDEAPAHLRLDPRMWTALVVRQLGEVHRSREHDFLRTLDDFLAEHKRSR